MIVSAITIGYLLSVLRGKPQTQSLVRKGDFVQGQAARAAKVTHPSPIEGVSDEAWTKFERTVATSPTASVSDSNALGRYEMSVRRLADLGLVTGARRVRAPNGRMVWTGHFAAPMTVERFLSSEQVQRTTLGLSMKSYADQIRAGAIPLPQNMSLAGALAVLHKSGRGGLTSSMFPATAALYDAAKHLF